MAGPSALLTLPQIRPAATDQQPSRCKKLQTDGIRWIGWLLEPGPAMPNGKSTRRVTTYLQ